MPNGQERDEKGRFAKGNGGGPGRPRREREVEYYRIMETEVTPSDWRAIVSKATDQAKRGDAVARKWLSDYLMGQPVQKHEHGGEDGSPIEIIVTYVKNPPDAAGPASGAAGNNE